MRFNGFYILNTEPLIISFLGGYPFFYGFKYENQKFSHQPLPKWFKPKHVLEHLSYWSGSTGRILRHKLKANLHRIEGRKHHLIVNANDEEIQRKRFSVCGGHFNHNIYINEHLYKPLNEPKIYDAIYTAQLLSFKRHALAKNIKNLMIVSYGGDLHTFCPDLKHADFNREFLPRHELAKKYNQSHVGLCLSAIEGTMLASCEYLLSGIPVVSTPSKGGRDEFFTPENSIIVPPQPEAVAEAVEHWKYLSPEPEFIREQILQNINHIRKKYCIYISQIIEKENGIKKDPEAIMENYFAFPEGIQSRFIKFSHLHKFSLKEFNSKFKL